MNLYYGQLPLCECIRPRSSTSIACHNEYHYNDCDSPPAAKRMKTPLCHIITSCCYNDCSSPPAAKRRKASFYHIISLHVVIMAVKDPLLQRERKPHYIISYHVVIMAVKAPLLHREGKPHYIISYHIITSYHYHNRNPPRCKEKESPPTTKMISQVQLC